MPFPSSERESYARNPLEEVICQLRFPPILQVSASIPSNFQNRVRKDFPLYSERDPSIMRPPPGVPQELAEILTSFPSAGVKQPKEHRFTTEDEMKLISFNQDFFAYSVKFYETWKDFRKEFLTAEISFREIYQPTYYSRAGLRYRDRIDREDLGLSAVPWSLLLNPELAGLIGTNYVGEEVEDTLSQTTLRIPELQSGFIQIRHGLVRNTEPDHQIYLIDIDLFSKVRMELDDVPRTLDVFNRTAGNCFRWAITPRLREALGPTHL